MSDLASTSGTGCPSLLNTLRQFRPRKRCAQQSITTTTPLPGKGPEPRNEPISPPSESKDNILIPGTLELPLKKAVQELGQSSVQAQPDIQASTCSTSSLKESEVSGSGEKKEQLLSSNSEGDDGPKKWGRPVYNRAKKALTVECSARDGLTKRYMTNRERSLKELRKEFQTTDIETVLQALVACKWNVSRARAYLLNEPHFEVLQRGAGPEEGDCKPNLATLVEALRKRGFSSDDVYVENLTRGLSQRKYMGVFRQPLLNTDPKQCERPRNATRRPRARRRPTELALEEASRELAQSSGRGCPDMQAPCSSSYLKESAVAGGGVKRKQVPPSNSDGDKGPQKWGRPVYNRAKKTFQVECSVQDSLVKQHATNRERSLKELREEFRSADIETVLAALVACNWDVVQAQAYLRNKSRFMGYSQQSDQESEEKHVKPNLANMSGTVGKREDVCARNFGGAQSRERPLGGRRWHRRQAEEAQHSKEAAEDGSSNEDSCGKNTSGGECPDVQATASTSQWEESKAAGSGVKRQKVPSSSPEGDEDGSVERTRDMTRRERSLKQLRKEFRTTDIVGSTVLQALAACNWDTGQARTYLVNKFHVTGHSQQHSQGSEERDAQPSEPSPQLAHLSGAPGKRGSGGFCSEGIYVKNLKGGLSKVVFFDGFSQRKPEEAREAGDDSDSDDCCDENMYVKDLSGGLTKLGAFRDLEHCAPLHN